jgi:HPt (histidine-containing phosphotransfer) domain-containing protein
MVFKTINLAYLLEVTEGNKDLIIELIEIYKAQIPEFIELFKSNLEQKNWKNIGAIAHKAKSSVAVMGLNNLSEMLKTFETLAKEGIETNKYSEFIKEFEIITLQSVDELNKYLKNLN